MKSFGGELRSRTNLDLATKATDKHNAPTPERDETFKTYSYNDLPFQHGKLAAIANGKSATSKTQLKHRNEQRLKQSSTIQNLNRATEKT